MQSVEPGHNGKERHGVSEGRGTKELEQVSSTLPSDFWLFAAGASILTSLGLRISGRKSDALFVGQWAPTLLIIGVYNKLVKQFGSEGPEPRRGL